jgi:hypothetical protein
MATLDAADITITIERQLQTGKLRTIYGTLAIAGTDSYGTAGIPLPAIGVFGFKSYMDTLVIYGQTVLTNMYVYTYNKAAHKLQIFEEEATAAGGPLLECDTSEVPGARTLHFIATGW